MKAKQIKRIVADAIVGVGYLLLIIGILMFLILNEGVFFNTVVMGVIWAIALVILPILYVVFERKHLQENRGKKWKAFGALLIAAITLFLCVYFSSIADFLQPLVLNSMTQILLIVAGVLLLVGALVEMMVNRSLISLSVSIMLLATMFVGIIWANTEGYKDFNKDVIVSQTRVFENGEDGYATFRIPSIVALDHEVINEKKGASLTEDILLATAEGRKDSSHDTGSIDMVGKISRDGGKTWGKLQVLYSYSDEVGKYGNPTPVLDSNTGNLIFPYMTATRANDYNYDTYVAVCPIDSEGNITFPSVNEHVNISFEKGKEESAGSDGVRSYTLMVGPGKSIQLEHGEHAGRILIPASGGGHSFVMYLDKGLDPLAKENWKQSEYAGEGNECEAVELSNGEICMVVRDNTGCCANHFKQYQRLSFSNDGGATWYKKTEDTTLRAPICMSSVAKLSDGTMLLSYPDSFYTRVNLTIGVSRDNAGTFSTTSLYGGPTGYSCMAVDSDDNVYILAEIGKVDYNEELILLKVDSTKLVK